MVSKPKANPTLIMGIAALVLLVLAFKVRHPLLMIASGALLVISYQRFRRNAILHRQKQSKIRNRGDAIEVEAREIRDTEPR
ncbi:MAG: hypothetical protein ABQ298_06090 [Puniceicoccaceae bacterium]